VTLPITSRVGLVPGVARIDVRTVIDNRARDHRLRVHFPAPIAVQAADHDAHFEVVRRAVGVPEKGADWIEDPRPEVPQRAFTDVSDGRLGLAIANRGLPEVEVLRGPDDATTEIALTLLRCVGWLSRDDMPVRQGHAGPAFETPGAQMIGEWAFDYAIIPHAAGWQQARAEAYAFQTGLRTAQTGLHDGELPDSGAFLAVEPAQFVLSAVKRAEDGSGWIARGYNPSADPISVTLTPLRRVARAVRITLAEEEVEDLPMASSGAVTLPVGGRQVVTVRFSD
jgi:alpha-mannosidase